MRMLELSDLLLVCWLSEEDCLLTRLLEALWLGANQTLLLPTCSCCLRRSFFSSAVRYLIDVNEDEEEEDE